MTSAPQTQEGASVVVKSLAGEPIAELSGEQIAVLSKPGSALTVRDVKAHIDASNGYPLGLQRFVASDRILLDDEEMFPAGTQVESLHLTLVMDESPLFTWDIQNNPDRSLLAGSDGEVTYAIEQYDYVNVITVEPVRIGTHFFEFMMHRIGDEQWCGVTASARRAGHRGCLNGWFYYCGRRSSTRGALHAGRERHTVEEKRFGHVKNGDVIGMLLDVDAGGVAFSLNGVVQGACVVPKEPLFLTTCLDRGSDHVELRKPPVASAPSGAREALAAAVAQEELFEFDEPSW